MFHQNKYVQHIVISKLILFKKLSLQLISYGVNSHLESKSQDGYSERAANCTWTFVHAQKGIHVCRYLHCRGHLRREKILDDHQTSSKVNTYIMTNHWVTITPRWTSTRIDRRWHYFPTVTWNVISRKHKNVLITRSVHCYIYTFYMYNLQGTNNDPDHKNKKTASYRLIYNHVWILISLGPSYLSVVFMKSLCL